MLDPVLIPITSLLVFPVIIIVYPLSKLIECRLVRETIYTLKPSLYKDSCGNSEYGYDTISL